MFSVPCLGLLCHFLSPVVFVVSLYLILFSLLASCILYIQLSSVLCELLNVTVVCLHVILFLFSVVFGLLFFHEIPAHRSGPAPGRMTWGGFYISWGGRIPWIVGGGVGVVAVGFK